MAAAAARARATRLAPEVNRCGLRSRAPLAPASARSVEVPRGENPLVVSSFRDSCNAAHCDHVAAASLPHRSPPFSSRVLFVRNLPFNITPEEMYEIFGKYGAVRQIRL